MNTYNFDVNYTKGVVYGPNILLVSNDHNSTIFKFNFDQTGRHVFKLLYPDGTCYVQDIIDNQLILTKGILNQEGNYQFEVSLYKDDSRLTTARIKEFPVRLELVDTDSVVQPDDRVPILDNLIEETNKVVEAAKKGEFDGATFTPNVSENGDLSWTNDKGKENPPTVNIKGEPGEPGEPGAVKMQVVDTLPEVGETDTIYLLKKDTPGDDNYYDEYVYTTNNGWEHIGDTSVDLTDYYTKEETDNKLDNKQDKINRFYVVDCKNTLGDSFDEIKNIYDTDILNQLTNIINECYTNSYKSIAILFSGKNSFITYARHGSDFSTQRYSYHLYGYLNLEDTYDTTRIYTRIVRTEINGTWNNNVFTANGLFLNFSSQFIVPDTSQVLTKTNTTSYTPTNDYNPATKKYVDDNKYTLPIASASTLGGIKVGENLTIDENGVLSAGGGEPEMYILEFSGNYNSSRQYNATDNDKIRIAELITTLKEDANVPIYVKFKNGYGLLFTPLYDIQPGQQPYYLYQCLKYNNSNLRVLYFCGLNIYGTWENDIFTVSTCTVSTDTNGFLSTGTQSLINDGFNPTLDQHPATKKYVDDAVASAGGGNGETSVYKLRTSLYSYSFLSTIGSLYLTSDVDKFTEFINSIGDGKGTLLYLCGSLAGTTTGFNYIPEGYLFTLADDDSIINKTNIKFVSSFTATNRITTSTNFISTYIFDLSIRGSWTDGVFTCTSVVLTKAIRYSLPTNNTSAYTPTSDYNPATKKYVDDTVSSNSFKLENENIYVLTGNINIAAGSINTDDLAKATEIATDIYLKTKENSNYAYNVIVQCNGDASKGLTVYMNHISGRNDVITFIGICFYNGYWQQIYCTLKGSFDTSTNKYNVTKIDMSSDYMSLQSIQPRFNSEVANKQYVDSTHYKNMTGYDATKTQVLKNINGTLTWVDEQ